MFDELTSRRLAMRASAAAACSVVAASWLAAPSAYADPGDPNGNNGTVKIAEVGDVDEIPDTEPHPGCTVAVQWFGFDEGADVSRPWTSSCRRPPPATVTPSARRGPTVLRG